MKRGLRLQGNTCSPLAHQEMYSTHKLVTVLRRLGALVTLWLVYSCANPAAPEGGPTDTEPPKLNPKRYSTPDLRTNVRRDNQIILTFDEWIKLQDAYNQVVISPPLRDRPEIKIRNKSVVLEWNEPLKDSTTYIIQFGESIRDLTENNAAKSIRRIFSTGPVLDSLTCSGQVIDAATRSPKPDVLVMLYRNLADSLPKTQKPYYFAKTDAQGNFKIDYIRSGRYRIFALDDKTRDYKYNLPTETIGFLDSSFLIVDTIQPFLRLSMFQERQPTKVVDSDLIHYGYLKVRLNNAIQTPSTFTMLEGPADFKLQIEQAGDSLECWFDGSLAEDENWEFVIENPAEDLLDTIRMKAKSRADFMDGLPLFTWQQQPLPEELRKDKTYQDYFQDTTPVTQHPDLPLELTFEQSIAAIDTSQLYWLRDTSLKVEFFRVEEYSDSNNQVLLDTSIETRQVDTFLREPFNPIAFKLSKTDSRMIEGMANLAANRFYKVVCLPGALENIWGQKNVDTLSMIFLVRPKTDYGYLTGTIKGVKAAEHYLIQLVKDNKTVIDERLITDSTQIKITYPRLLPANYTIRVVIDQNANGRWDVGSYDELRQAETTVSSKPIGLKAGWENEMEVLLNPTKKNNDPSQTSSTLPTDPRERRDE